jgi:hypothetical protein
MFIPGDSGLENKWVWNFNLVDGRVIQEFINEADSQYSRNDKQRMERSQLPPAPTVQESGSPRTTPLDMRNKGIPQSQ